MVVEYVFRPNSFHVVPADESDERNLGFGGEGRLVGFDLRVERRGRRLGGNNSQVTVRAPEANLGRRAISNPAVLTLPSGWVVTVRNKFAEQPEVAVAILTPLADELDKLIVGASEAVASGEFDLVRTKLFDQQLRGEGPDYWR